MKKKCFLQCAIICFTLISKAQGLGNSSTLMPGDSLLAQPLSDWLRYHAKQPSDKFKPNFNLGVGFNATTTSSQQVYNLPVSWDFLKLNSATINLPLAYDDQ